MLDQTLIGIKQPKPLIELVEFNVAHHRPRQAASIDAALNKIPALVADAPSRPAADIGTPLNVLPSPRAGLFSYLVSVAKLRILAEIRVMDSKQSVLKIGVRSAVQHVAQGRQTRWCHESKSIRGASQQVRQPTPPIYEGIRSCTRRV